MRKTKIPSEVVYALAILFLALSVALLEKAYIGVPLEVSPAHALYFVVKEFWPFFTLGMAEIIMQSIVILIMICIMKKSALSHLWSLVTAVIYAVVLDGILFLLEGFHPHDMATRVALFLASCILMPIGVELMFRTHVAHESDELFVLEISEHCEYHPHAVKAIFYISCGVVAAAIELIVFKHWDFQALGVGTIVFLFTKTTMCHFTGSLIDLFFDVVPISELKEKRKEKN